MHHKVPICRAGTCTACKHREVGIGGRWQCAARRHPRLAHVRPLRCACHFSQAMNTASGNVLCCVPWLLAIQHLEHDLQNVCCHSRTFNRVITPHRASATIHPTIAQKRSPLASPSQHLLRAHSAACVQGAVSAEGAPRCFPGRKPR